MAEDLGKPDTSGSVPDALAVVSGHEEEQFSQCWICLEPASSERGELVAPCSCSKRSGRVAHTRCLARWQLQNAGTRRELECEFCHDPLPDWKQALTPACGAAAPAIMNVAFGGTTYSFQVKPGAQGYADFTRAICRAFNLPSDAELNITFTCDEPSSVDAPAGSLLTLQGPGAFDAAVHCASVSAARRSAWQQSHPSSSGSASPSSVPSSPARPRSRHANADGSAATQRHNVHATNKSHVLAEIGQRIRSALADFFA